MRNKIQNVIYVVLNGKTWRKYAERVKFKDSFQAFVVITQHELLVIQTESKRTTVSTLFQFDFQMNRYSQNFYVFTTFFIVFMLKKLLEIIMLHIIKCIPTV